MCKGLGLRVRVRVKVRVRVRIRVRVRVRIRVRVSYIIQPKHDSSAGIINSHNHNTNESATIHKQI